MHELILSAAFQRQVKKLVKQKPSLKPKLTTTLKHLQKSIRHPSLRLHKLSGSQNWSVSVTEDLRSILHWEGNQLYCLRIGSHDEVY